VPCKRYKFLVKARISRARGGLSRSDQMHGVVVVSSHGCSCFRTPNLLGSTYGWFVTRSISLSDEIPRMYGTAYVSTAMHGIVAAVRTGGFVHRTYTRAGGQFAVCRTDGWDQLGAGEAIHQPSGRKKKSRRRLCKATTRWILNGVQALYFF
jgi:hypothetical protein